MKRLHRSYMKFFSMLSPSTMIYKILLLLLLFVGLVQIANAEHQLKIPPRAITPEEVVSKNELPVFGKWMLNYSYNIASWLGVKLDSKLVREPINIILIDRRSQSIEEAEQRLEESCNRAGYPSRFGHSFGYFGIIGENFYSQFPTNWLSAYSNNVYTETNDHGRFFGPYYVEGKYYFIGAFSREDFVFNLFAPHTFNSFIAAREDFTNNLIEKSDYHLIGTINMDNQIYDSTEYTTGDHDGQAAVLELSP